MSSSLLPNIWRFLLAWAVQILILRPIALSGGSWLAAFIYPIFILFLPVTMPTALVVLLSFAMGLSIDVFYDSPGVHAGASVFTAWFRSFLLAVFEPRGGFAGNQIPTKYHFGNTWFLQFVGAAMAAHLLFYYSLDYFSIVFFFQIIGKTAASLALSMIFIVIYSQLFDPKN